MGRTKDLLYDDVCTWQSSREGRQFQRERELLRQEAKRLRDEQERSWQLEFPLEWAAWLKLEPLWGVEMSFADKPYDFEDFLDDVGPAPSKDCSITRKDERLAYQLGNLKWVKPREISSPYLNLDEAAAYCHLARKTLQNQCTEGNLSSLPGRPKLFRKENLDSFLNTRCRSK